MENLSVPIAVAVFALAIVACFSSLAPRRAVLYTMLGGWLFLPHFHDSCGIPYLTSKLMVVGTLTLLGSLAFDSGRWIGLSLRPMDVLVAVMCASPFATALSNDLGAKEALSATLETTLEWAPAYLLGRTYFGTPRGLRDYASAFVAAGFVYIPFCLWEVRMSPNLHYWTYGFSSWRFDQSIRYGGYRPAVFMQHGLAVGMFMAMATLTAYWLWRTKARQRVGFIPLGWGWIGLCATTILCKSTGAIALLAAGVAVLEGTRRLRISLLVLLLASAPAAYCAARIGGWSPLAIVDIVRGTTDEDRARSLAYRNQNEDLLVRKAMQRPVLGWGRFARSFVLDEQGHIVSVPDGRWVIVLGVAGLVGLIALGAALLLPTLIVLQSCPARYWADPRVASAAAVAVAVLLWAIDDLLNDMRTPIVPAIVGALISLSTSYPLRRSNPRPIEPSTATMGRRLRESKLHPSDVR
jgi:hypothetical protein